MMRAYLLHDAEAAHIDLLRRLDALEREVWTHGVELLVKKKESEQQLTPAPGPGLVASSGRRKRLTKARGKLHAIK